MNKHTPGPWRVQTTDFKGCYLIQNIEEIGCLGGYHEDEANARLIAAAPNLKELLQDYPAGDGNAALERWLTRVRAVLFSINQEST